MSLRSLALVVTLLACFGFSASSLFAQAAVASVENFTQYREQADALLAKMSLAEKIGQMTQAELGALGDLSEVADLYLGSVLSGGSSDPEAGNSLAAWTRVVEACQDKALSTRLGIPILYGVDAVHGHSNLLGAVIFPHNIGLGCTRDVQLVEEINRVTAKEVRASAINWNFAPCVTVPRDDRWGRTYEGFSENPDLVTQLGEASVRGLQTGGLDSPLAVLACAKHYVGDGGTSGVMAMHKDWEGFGDKPKLMFDQGDTRVDEATLRRVHLAPYDEAIAAGVGSIMPSYSSWNGQKCTGSKYLLTDVLKGELGFEGFLISDYNAVDQVDEDYKTAIEKSINAGIDMVMVPTKYREFITLLTELVNEGKVPIDRIDDAVRRILQVKAAMGLLAENAPVKADPQLKDSFGSDAHRQVAREAVRKSLVLLKNEDQLLPLSKSFHRIHITGPAADDIGLQCGGWTIEWQGKAGDVTTGGTTVLAAVKQLLGDSVEVTNDADGSGAAGADAAIVVIGEKPYAEGMGDNHELTLSAADQALVAKVTASGTPTVVVLFSGRPLILGNVLDRADALIAAWLPGTEGAGIADVLFGDHAPTGKLSFTWPRSVDQHPINVGDNPYDPQFPFGFGLSYEAK